MSQYPSNFGQSPGGPSHGGPSYGGPSYGGPGGSPYASGPQQPAPRKGPNWLLIIGIAVGVLALGGAAFGICCCGGGALAIPALTQVVGDEVAKQVADDPVIQERIGDIEKITYNFGESMEASSDGGEMMAFDVEGSKGDGLLIIEGDNNGDQLNITYGELVMPDGTFNLEL
ncbi:MAG TPA: hypothetical protein VGN57_18020 [Pirellulaceae bacterium]|jgi:hypothetical protein|nr:hypothetical protein [Pirellulaceae bacterium]